MVVVDTLMDMSRSWLDVVVVVEPGWTRGGGGCVEVVTETNENQ